MIIKGSQIVDISLAEENSGYFNPIVGVENGRVIDFDRKMHEYYWVEGKDENVRLNFHLCILILEMCLVRFGPEFINSVLYAFFCSPGHNIQAEYGHWKPYKVARPRC